MQRQLDIGKARMALDIFRFALFFYLYSVSLGDALTTNQVTTSWYSSTSIYTQCKIVTYTIQHHCIQSSTSIHTQYNLYAHSTTYQNTVQHQYTQYKIPTYKVQNHHIHSTTSLHAYFNIPTYTVQHQYIYSSTLLYTPYNKSAYAGQYNITTYTVQHQYI